MSKALGSVVGAVTKPISSVVGTVVGGLTGAGGGPTSILGGGSGGGTQTVTTTPNVPQYVADYQNQMFNLARGTAAGIGSRQFADFSGLQNQGFNALSGLNQNAGMQGAQNALGQLQGMGFGADRIDPTMVQGTGYNAALANAGRLGDAKRVAAQSFLQGDMRAYQNPYTEQVINQSLADNDRARLMQQQGINAQALSRGAFGGSRQAIAESENSRNFLDQQARTSAQLRNQGFDTAAGLMQQDMTRALQAGLSNQQAANQFALQRYAQDANTSQFNAANQTAASQFGADAAMRASLANQAAGLTAGTQNANNQLQAQQLRAGALSNALSGGLQFNNSFLGNVNAQLQGGAMQQDLQQQRMDAMRNLPLERLGILSSTFTGGQLPYGQSQTSPVQRSNPFLGALGGAAAGAGIGSAIGGAGLFGLSAGATGAGLGALAAFL